MVKIGVVSMAAILLAACSNPWAEYRPTDAERIKANWQEAWSPPVPPVYCYRTLARVDCFSRPQVNQQPRLVGAYDDLAQ